MSELRPVKPDSVVTMTWEYDVSEDWINAEIDRTGVKPSRRWAFDIDLSQDVIDPLQRHRLREAFDAYMQIEEYIELPFPTEDVDVLLHHVEPWLRAIAAKGSAEAEVLKERDRRRRYFETNRQTWVEEHGSPRLRLALARGYKVNRLYTQERAALEMPGFWADTNDSADAAERTDPSAEALALETNVQQHLKASEIEGMPRIVWLKEPPSAMAEAVEEHPWLVFESQEAVAVDDYLGRYRMFLPLDVDFRNPLTDRDFDEDDA